MEIWAHIQVLDALCRLQRSQDREDDIVVSFPKDKTEAGSGREGGSRLEAEYPAGNAGIMALTLEGVSVFYLPGTVDAVTGDSEYPMPGSTKQRSTAVFVPCGGDGSIFGVEEFLKVIVITDADWKARDCVRIHQVGQGGRLVRNRSGTAFFA